MTEANDEEEVEATGPPDSDRAQRTSTGEPGSPPSQPVVRDERRAVDATVIVHKPGTQPPDISDIVDTSADEPAAGEPPPPGPATDADPVDGAVDSDVDLGLLPPPVLGPTDPSVTPDGAEAMAAAADTTAPPPPPGTGSPEATDLEAPLVDGGSAPARPGLDAMTVEMPAGGMAAYLESESVGRSPVPTDAAPPSVEGEAESTVDEPSQPEPAPPPPPGLSADLLPPAEPPPPPPALTDRIDGPTPSPLNIDDLLPPTDPEPPEPTPSADGSGEAETASADGPDQPMEPPPADAPAAASGMPSTEAIVGAIEGLDIGPVSIDRNPTGLLPAIDPEQAQPPDGAGPPVGAPIADPPPAEPAAEAAAPTPTEPPADGAGPSPAEPPGQGPIEVADLPSDARAEGPSLATPTEGPDEVVAPGDMTQALGDDRPPDPPLSAEPATPTNVDPADFDLASAEADVPAGPVPGPGTSATPAFSPGPGPGPEGDDTNPIVADAPPPPPGSDPADAGATMIATPPLGPLASGEPLATADDPTGTDAGPAADDATQPFAVVGDAGAIDGPATDGPGTADIPPAADVTVAVGDDPAGQTTVAPASPADGGLAGPGPALPPGALGSPDAPEATVVAHPGSLDPGGFDPGGPTPDGSSPTTPDAGSTTELMIGAPEAAAAAAASPSPGPVGPDGDGSHDGRPGSPVAESPRKKRRRGPLVALVVILGLIALLVGAWLFDTARTDGQVARGTLLGTTPIGGFDSEQLDALAADLDTSLAQTNIELTVGDSTVARSAGELGARIDREHLADTALDARQGGFVALRPVRWVSTFFTEERIEPRYEVDPAATEVAVADINSTTLAQAIEPDLSLNNGQFSVVDGQPGVRIEADGIIDALPDELSGDAPFAIDVAPLDATPRFTNDQIAAVADEITTATDGPVNFQVLDQSTQVDGSQLRSWIVLDTDGDEPAWQIDEIVALDELRPLFPALGAEDQQARFSVVDGDPIIIPASETVVCCTTESLRDIRAQLDEPLPTPPEDEDPDDDEEPVQPVRVIAVDPEVVGSDAGVEELESLGIIEEVSTFTTEHACCQNRVTNIQRFADLTRGAIIRPGEDFSLNGHVGRRTTENGFVADGAIVNGILEPQVGGGVSQFATTFFNAAFYAGIDFNEYQSHSLYISRYPRGREATISFPRPDLSVKNTTDYGILVWTEYTPTSITVTFYSTKHIEVEDLPLVRSSRAQCSVFTTPRVRTYPDGEVVEDSVFALYRPGEGFDCNGNSTRPPEDPEGPTTAPEPEPVPTPEPDPTPAPEPDPGPDPEPPPPPAG